MKGIPAAAFAEWPLDMVRSSRTPSGNHRFEMALNQRTSEGLKAIARSHDSSLHIADACSFRQWRFGAGPAVRIY